jgi:hypothetical protein
VRDVRQADRHQVYFQRLVLHGVPQALVEGGMDCRRYSPHAPKPIELPPAVARDFLVDKNAFFAEKNAVKADAIAARQLHALRQHYTGKLKLIDVREMFLQMRDQS